MLPVGRALWRAGRVLTALGVRHARHLTSATGVGQPDVLVIGGGVVGSATAYWLKRMEPRLKVVVVERDSTYRRASTPLSAGSIRQQFSVPENIRLSLYSSQFLKNVSEHLSVDGRTPVELNFVEGGYLFLATAQGMEILQQNHAVQKQCGADVALLTPEQMQTRFPWLNTDELAGGSLGLSGEGWFDPHSLLVAFRNKARALGAEYVEDDVVSLQREGDAVRAVQLQRMGPVQAGQVVLAAGAWSGQLAATAQLPLPVTGRSRTIFVVQTEQPLPRTPLTIDPSGVYFRPEGRGFICGVSPPADEDRDTLEPTVDWPRWEEIWARLAHRVPAFAAARVTNAWAGLYDFNCLDHNGIVGRHPAARNLLLATGFSGHGLQQSPAVGRAVAELATAGRFVTLDLSRMGVERVLAGRPLLELNVV